MTEIIPFKYGNHEVRTVTVDGEPWFVATDVCAVLELANPASSLSLLDEDERGLHTVDTPGGPQKLSTVNEPGLYSLVLRSRKPEAKAFKRWVTHEVLPAIRRTGSYSVQPKSQIDILRAALDHLEAVEAKANEAQAIAKRTEARVDALEGQHDWVSALGFARLHNLPTSAQWLQWLGKTASEIAKAEGIEPVKVPHAYYGSVNSYPEWLWQRAYEIRRWPS